jgi:C-terminal processing protease CtpA/Prc
MKKSIKFFCLLFISLIGFQSCEDLDDTLYVPAKIQIHNFIWNGLNQYYLWQEDVPELSDSRFADQGQLNAFLESKGTPENLFTSLLNKPISNYPAGVAVDRFSMLVSDYTYLENLFQGVTKNNGVDYSLKYKSGSTTEIFGWVRYIIPGSDAATKNIQRGAIFYAINGIPLTISNYRSLLQSENYTLNLANYDNGAITPNGLSVNLTKTQLTENPVFQSQVLQVGNHKVAYLVYNGFTANFDSQLNTAFGDFIAQGATHLVLDLRYNSGGSVESATRLASMITGQFNGQLFSKERWNNKIQNYYETNRPDQLVNNFKSTLDKGIAINSMRLSKVYVLTTKSTASASELVINGLKPYINVIQIGDVTTGKNEASTTLYDSRNFGSNGRNPNHKYAIQPLVLKMANKDGFGDYQNGLAPTITLKEDLGNLLPLGDPNELLLEAALNHISSNGRSAYRKAATTEKDFTDAKNLQPFGAEMYLKETPSDFNNAIK